MTIRKRWLIHVLQMSRGIRQSWLSGGLARGHSAQHTRKLQPLTQSRRSHAASSNIIPDETLLRLNVRTFDAQVREAVLSAIKRIIDAEATPSRAPKPPTFTVVGEFPLTTKFWFVGDTDPQKYAQADQAGRLNELPSNHSPQFAPVLNPTLRIGIEAMLAAAGPWLATVGAKP